MQELLGRSFSTECLCEKRITFEEIARLSNKKSAGYRMLASIPPTFAAARNTS